MTIEIRWIPGHEGVVGNEKADVEAKGAAQRGSSPATSLPRFLRHNLLTSHITAHQQQLSHIKEQAASYMQQSHRLLKIKKIDGTTPSDQYIKILQVL